MPAHLLDDATPPASRLFVRNNGLPKTDLDPAGWTLEIAGESVEGPRTFTLAELERDFPHHTLRLQLASAGNGRAEFRPRAPGIQWTTGAIGCPEWTGIRLRDVLARCGVRPDAVHPRDVGGDLHASGDPTKVPIDKAMEEETGHAFALGRAPIPALHGGPLRLVCSGWPGSVSGKWLRRLLVRDRVHDGAKMGGASYRVPCHPVEPGAEVPDEEMCIIGSMPVKSLITSLRSGTVHAFTEPLAVGGFARAGDLAAGRVDVSIDFGRTWQPTRLEKPANRLAWQRFTGSVRLPVRGSYEVWSRATDMAGIAQPMLVPGWNPRSYLNNACRRVAVRVA